MILRLMSRCAIASKEQSEPFESIVNPQIANIFPWAATLEIPEFYMHVHANNYCNSPIITKVTLIQS